MDEQMRRLRAEVQRLAEGKPRSQIRYPDVIRRAAVALARTRLGQETGSVARLAREIGVSEPTLTKWLRPPAGAVLRPVAITTRPTTERPAGSRPVLITPNSVRVEGLDGAALVAVLQALG
jgi:predicted transcriptional regulator